MSPPGSSVPPDLASQTGRDSEYERARMFGRRATVKIDAETITVRGPQVREVLRRRGLRAIFVGASLSGWTVPRHKSGRDRAGDVIAALQYAGYDVAVSDADGEATSSQHDQVVDNNQVGDEAGLW